ncbi:dihydrofolate reductase family protein [Microbacterium sp. NPDC089695]|uniref:dihydrofolate reductase family protein n=1 Tax=Microbacterium sp. NPDC089695 TaxID=3364198 RepID=UPI00381AFB86
MRQVIANTIASLDRFVADAVGNPLVLHMDEAFDRMNLEDIEGADVVMLGRTSFDGFSASWPFIADAPTPADPDSPEGRALDDTNRAISRAFNAVAKVVVSDSGDIAPDNAWASTTTRIARDDALEWLRAARADGDGSILLFASGVLRDALLAAGLLDDLHVMVSPTTLGSGVPLHTTPASLALQEARTFDGSPNVQLRYRVVR